MSRRRNLLFRVLVYVVIVYAASGVVLTEANLRPGRASITKDQREAAAQTTHESGATLADVQIASFDGIQLKGWLFRPAQGNGDAVVVLHGKADNRDGMLPYANLLLRHGYIVLDPDSRAHGDSGGSFATYGVLEAQDVHYWVNWLLASERPRHLFGLGESMGAAVLLQSLVSEQRFSGVIAESSFASFREEAYDWAGYTFKTPQWARPLYWPAIEFGFLYARVRYAIDFDLLSPMRALRRSEVPVLLIHGVNDKTVPIRHSRLIRAARQAGTELWEVPNTGHTGTLDRWPSEFEARTVEFFNGTPREGARL